MRPGPRRRIRGLLRLTIAVVGLCVALLVFGYLNFRGFSRALIADFRYSTWPEFVDQYTFLKYYGDYYALLSDEDADRFYELPSVRDHPEWSDFEKGKLHYHRGGFEAAVAKFSKEIEEAGQSESALFWLGAAHLRSGEASNCLCRLEPAAGLAAGAPIADGTKLCSLPITTPHLQTDASVRAAECFTELLDEYDSDNPLYRWLLNFSCMAAGSWPESVPERYRVTSAFTELFYGGTGKENERLADSIRFHDAARELGVGLLDAGKGVAVEDFDKDGYLDIVTGGTFSGLKYFRNVRGQRFVDATSGAGLERISQCYIITAADYDNDGWMDLLVSRPFTHPALLRNTGGGSFEDVTEESGLLSLSDSENEAEYTCVSAWGDVDRDGDLDLFLAQFGQKLPMAQGLLSRKASPSKLLINAEGKFRDATREFGLRDLVRDAIFIGACFGDYDRDGWPDLFLSSFSRTQSVLLKNAKGKRFQPTSLIWNTDPGFMAAFVDVDHDGFLDLFQGSQAPARTTAANCIVGKSSGHFTNKIFLQRNGEFENRADFFTDGIHISTMGASYGDVNNDGCWDFYLGTGNPEGWNMVPNLMYLGVADGTRSTGRMLNISNLNGVASVQKGHGIVFFDFDNDGDQDIYSSLGGMWPGDAWPNQLLVNGGGQAAQNSWIRLRLRGRETNYFGVGCVIRIDAVSLEGDHITRWHHMDNKTGFGSAPYIAHVGLMNAEKIETLEVYWPASDQVKRYEGCLLNEMQTIDERDGRTRRVQLAEWK